MTNAVCKVLLDLQGCSEPIEIHAGGLDFGTRTISVTFCDGGSPYLLSKDTSVVFIARTPSGKWVETDAPVMTRKIYPFDRGADMYGNAIDGSAVELTIPDEIITEEGVTDCEFVLRGVKTGAPHPMSVELHSPRFRIRVSASLEEERE